MLCSLVNLSKTTFMLALFYIVAASYFQNWALHFDILNKHLTSLEVSKA